MGKGGSRQEHHSICILMSDRMRFSFHNASPAHAPEAWCDEEPQQKVYRIFLGKKNTQKTESESATEGTSETVLRRKAGTFMRRKCFYHDLQRGLTSDTADQFDASSEELAETEPMVKRLWRLLWTSRRGTPRKEAHARVKEASCVESHHRVSESDQ